MPFGKPFVGRKRDGVDNVAFGLDLLSEWLPNRGYTAVDVVSALWTAPAGIVKTHESWEPATGKATVWLTGGTIGETYEMTLTVTLPPPAGGTPAVVKRFALEIVIVPA